MDNSREPGASSGGPRNPPPPPPPPGPPPQTIVLRDRPPLLGRLGRPLLAIVGLLLLALFAMASRAQQYYGAGEGPEERYHSLSKDATKKVALVNVAGAILESDDFVERQLRAIEADDSVVAMVLRIDSPGGTVTYSDRLLHKTRELLAKRAIPCVVSMGSVCASGGYYLAMAVGDTPDAIYAEPSTWTGSIGVVIPHYNFSRILGMTGVVDDSITSGELKLMGSPTRKMSDREREVLQTLVDQSFEGFKDVVRSGRPRFRDDDAALDAVATGQVFSAKQALELGLVDRLGFVEDAVARAAELAGETAEGLRCVEYHKPKSALDSVLGVSSQTQRPAAGGLDLAALVELTTPRAYYLWTLAPLLLPGGG